MARKNPFGSVNFRSPVVINELRHQGKGERVVANNGEINAGSVKELASVISRLMETAGTQEVISEKTAVERQEMAKLHRDLLIAAFNNESKHRELGEVMAEELYITSNREGFARRFLARQELSQGGIPIARLRLKNVVATVASSASKVETQLVRDQTFYPPEFYISTRIYVEKRDIDRSSSDILEEKFIEATEAVSVSEDRLWRNMAIRNMGIANNQMNIVGMTSPLTLGLLRNQVTRWGIPASYWVISNDVWNDIIADQGFSALIDPVSKHELLLTGQLGSILGMNIVSDAFRHPQHKVLDSGEQFVVGDAINHGQYTDRGGIESQPLDGTNESIPGRGWFMSETLSMLIANPRSIARAVRV